MKFKTNPYFCILPWVHLHISQNGRVSPCCNNNTYIGNVKENTISEIWNSKKFNTLRKQFKSNIPDKRCSHCYHTEKSGKESLRQISNKNYKKDFFRVIENKPKPIYLDIRFSNVCNFKCKTCWHGNSSSWYIKGSKKNASEDIIINAFINSFDELFDYINNVEEIFFAGGEPLIMEEHYLILAALEKRKLFDIKLRYNTNFSVLNYKGKNILTIWQKFNNVQVSASIDAIGKLGEDIREGFIWQKFIKNRKEMLATCPHIYFEIAPTVSSLNIDVLPQLHRTMVNERLLKINNIYLNILERPKNFNIQQLNEQQKEMSSKTISEHILWLKANNATNKVISEFKTLINYLNLKQ